MCNVVADVNDRVSDQRVWSWMREYDCDNSIAWRHTSLRRITYSRNSFGIFLRELFWQWAHQIHALSLAPVIVKLRSETSRRLFSRQWRAISENRIGFEFTIFSWPHCLSEDLGGEKRWTYLIDLRRISVKGGEQKFIFVPNLLKYISMLKQFQKLYELFNISFFSFFLFASVFLCVYTCCYSK